MEQLKIYVINCKNDGRRQRMLHRFSQLEIDFEFTDGCDRTDVRIDLIPVHNKQAAPCMLSHLDAIQKFFNTNYEYCIICEDDIHIKKSFKQDINSILNDFKRMNLDILLLSYLINFDPRSEKFTGYSYCEYGEDLWGSQMYLISRSYASYILSTFTVEASKDIIAFSSDWTITKNGNKALIFPMLAVEEGDTLSNNKYQREYHNDCNKFNFNSDYI